MIKSVENINFNLGLFFPILELLNGAYIIQYIPNSGLTFGSRIILSFFITLLFQDYIQMGG